LTYGVSRASLSRGHWVSQGDLFMRFKGSNDELREIILEVLEGEVKLADLMKALGVASGDVFHQICRDLQVADDLLIAKIQRDRAA